MRLYLQTADDWCRLWLNDKLFERQFGRELSKNLLRFLQQSLESEGRGWSDLDGIVVFRGPGSYTSLRIGITVANTLADGLRIPIVGSSGENWRAEGDGLLKEQTAPQVITPIYYQDAVITQPRK
ncbi:MAG: tRNA (adenosine(37)-N6)-threonylcarbamoyltransferase complex dimerization subunit type 1 TsaB [Candidatus Nanosyncoccaceae bacterium]